jgi:hypothetical protein
MAFRPLPMAHAIPVSWSQTHWIWAVARLLALEAEAVESPPHGQLREKAFPGSRFGAGHPSVRICLQPGMDCSVPIH